MTIDISADIEHFIQEEIACGNFSNGRELVEHAILLLKRDREEAVHGIMEGLEDITAGRVQSLREAF